MLLGNLKQGTKDLSCNLYNIHIFMGYDHIYVLKLTPTEFQE